MNINLSQDEINLILYALEDYKIEVEHWANCSSISIKQSCTENDIVNLIDYLKKTLDKNNEYSK